VGTCQEGCLGYYQEESPDCEGWCEVCGVCYDKGYCTLEQHYSDCGTCHKSHATEDHYIVTLAGRVQDISIQKTILAYVSNVCEVCNGAHKTYNCCDKCNYDKHTCVLCGDPLGHDEISSCYILEEMGVG